MPPDAQAPPSPEQQTAPAEVRALADLGRRVVADRLGVAPDGSPETLPLADAFLRTTAAEAAPKERRQLVLAVGCYFGEVARLHLHGRWAPLGPDPSAWRVELPSGGLSFSPVGMAAETLSGCETPGYDGALAADEALRADLAAMLEHALPLGEDEYYSLAGRIEVLEQVADWLIARAASNERECTPPPP